MSFLAAILHTQKHSLRTNLKRSIILLEIRHTLEKSHTRTSIPQRDWIDLMILSQAISRILGIDEGTVRLMGIPERAQVLGALIG